jgi:hypothetical protein
VYLRAVSRRPESTGGVPKSGRATCSLIEALLWDDVVHPTLDPEQVNRRHTLCVI